MCFKRENPKSISRGCWLLRFICVLTVCALWAGPLQTVAQKAKGRNPSEADLAWAELTKAIKPPLSPAEWKSKAPSRTDLEQFRKSQQAWAVQWSDAAADFYYRFPDHSMSQAARMMQLSALQTAWAMGAKDQSAKVDEIQKRLAGAGLTENQKFNLRWESAVRVAVSQMDGGKAAVNAELEKGSRALRKDFPQRPEPGDLLLFAAYRSDTVKAATLAAEIANGPGSPRAKHDAQQLLAKHVAKVRPVEMELNTIDGKKINLRTLKGKVVLLDFWNSGTAKSNRHVASVKQAFDQYHNQGLEVIGINFDPSDALLRESVKRGEIAWPQVWEAPTAKGPPWREYGLASLPAIWLLDQNGILRDDVADKDLLKKVESLLGKP